MTKDEALKMAIEDLEVVWGKDRESVIACREALEQPTQEPYAWMHNGEVYLKKQCKFFSKDMGKEFEGQIPLYTTPPSREWQGLSDDEIVAIFSVFGDGDIDVIGVARAIEAKLKEKNT